MLNMLWHTTVGVILFVFVFDHVDGLSETNSCIVDDIQVQQNFHIQNVNQVV